VDEEGGTRDRRAVTPAIVISGVFVAACAVFAVSFVSARGGLQMPIAASHPPVDVGSASLEPPAASNPSPVPPSPTIEPSSPPASPTPTITPTVQPPPPTVVPSSRPPSPIPTLAPGDPLLALSPCGDHPACRRYVVVRGDTLSGIISRFRLDIDVLQALNPGHLLDPSLIVTNELLYLGRSPLARLDPCPSGERCAIYVVQPGDTLSQIAARYLLTTDAILEANPGLPRPIRPGQEIKLPA
jgi:nucleoid-associated protein YgaU